VAAAQGEGRGVNALRALLAQVEGKATDSAEAKHLAAFVRDLLEDNGNDFCLISESMEQLISWAIEFRQAADKGSGRKG